MARKNIEKVIEAFLSGKPAKGDSKGTCSTDGTIVYSYAMPIAKRLKNGAVVIVPYEDGPSATTRLQINALAHALQPHCGHRECWGPFTDDAGIELPMGIPGQREECVKERIAKGLIPRIVRKSLGPVPNVPTGGSAYR